MKSWMERFALGDRDDAVAELTSELTEFSYDGLLQLCDDLGRRCVLRGTWDGCVFSYRNGGPGSVRRDRNGRGRNAFTVLWDAGRLTDEDVLAATRAELRRRSLDGHAAQRLSLDHAVISN